MAELLTHVLAAFIIAVVLSWKFAWITPPLVAAAMVGAAIPDLNRIRLVLPEATIEAVIGLPWRWGIFHRAGGVLVVCVLFSLLVPREYMKAVFGMLVLGAASHFFIDYFLWQPSGSTNLMLWPFADLTIEYQGFYRSSDRWTAVVSVLLASLVLVIDRRRQTESELVS